MHKARIRRNLIIAIAMLVLGYFPLAQAELRDAQSFRPIEWEESTTSSKYIHFLWMRPLRAISLAEDSQIDRLGEAENIFGLQVSQPLHSRWKGRLGLYLSRTGSEIGDALWSFAGSDLQHPLTPLPWKEKGFFSWFQPFGYFGLGFASRWENSQVRYNLVPTFRYNESEPAAYLGISSMIRLFGSVMFELDVRYFQSARVSQRKFLTLGGSFVLGRWESL